MREFTVYLDDELHAELCAEAARTGLKKAELVRAALKAAIAEKLAVPYKRPKPKDRKGRMKEALKYVTELLEGKAPVPRPGRRWKR